MEVKGEKLEIGYDGRIVVREMDITVKKGEITTIIGPNGSGKSTLLKALTRLLRCSMGCVYLNQEDLYNIDSKKLAKCIGVLPQRHCAPPDFKVRDLVGYGRVPYQKWYEQNTEEDEKIIEWALKATGTWALRDKSIQECSGGESQRIRLASQLGSGLVGVTYVLDEPSIGLHPRDNERLIATLRSLQGRGNTVLVVEHDEATIREADHIIELGPGSGAHGGDMVYHGSFENLIKHSETLTAKYMRGDLSVPIPDERREPKGWLTLRGVTTNNLKDIDCPIPLGTLTCVTGVSGSGKSSLVVDTLYKHLALAQGIRVDQPGSIRGIDGVEAIERIVAIDQTPIGRTPRSNPATYTKIFDEIRNIFAMTPDARKRGYQPGRFSFNVKGGRCEACSGDGQIRVEMHFLPDVYVTCDVCGGKRYNHETLEVRYRGLNISEVLDMPVREARQFFSNYPVLERRLAVLEDVGLDYIRLGQPATTLSGGEAQRIKISRELGKRSLPGTMYILDEPTTGLHMHEVGKLVTVLHHLVELGATVVVIEHNTDVILASDYVIDLGPGGGENGGRIVAAGTPEAIMADPNSVTGKFLTEERRTRRKLGDG